MVYQYKSRREFCLVGDKVPAVDYLIIFLNEAIMVGLALVCLCGFKSRREFVLVRDKVPAVGCFYHIF